MKSGVLVILTPLMLLFAAGCRTTHYGDLEAPLCVTAIDEISLYTAIVNGAKAANWDVLGTDGTVVHLRRTRNIHVVYVDASYGNGEITLQITNAENLKYHREDKAIHKTGYGWVAQLRRAIENAKVNRLVEERPYCVSKHIVSLSPGYKLSDVIVAVCELNDLRPISQTNGTVLVSYEKAKDLALEIRYGTMIFSISQCSIDGKPKTASAYNEFVKKVEGDIVRYADPAAWSDKAKSDREHFDNVRQEEQLQRVNRFMRWGF